MLKSDLIQNVKLFIYDNKRVPRVRDIPCANDHYKKYFQTWADVIIFCGGKPARQKLNLNDEEFKIWLQENVIITDTGCWEWQKTISHNGYGIVYYKKKAWYAHRLSFILFNGYIPPKNLVQHNCDNRKCINPKHLKLGTHKTNRIDCQNKNRWKYSPSISRPPYKITDKEKLVWYKNNHEEKDGGLNTECWTIIGGDLNKGSLTLYRKLFIAKFGYKPEIVGHRCHNKGCININHLYATTRSQNAKDSIHYHPHTKITRQQARNVLEDYLSRKFKWGEKKIFDRRWANKLKIPTGVIADIRQGNSWIDVRKELLNDAQQ